MRTYVQYTHCRLIRTDIYSLKEPTCGYTLHSAIIAGADMVDVVIDIACIYGNGPRLRQTLEMLPEWSTNHRPRLRGTPEHSFLKQKQINLAS